MATNEQAAAEAVCEICGAVLGESPVGRICPGCLLREAITPPASGAAAPALPRMFGAYELLEELGRGGMGVVFRARQASLDRIVALKMPAGVVLADTALRQRFRVEAAAGARLRHPHIVSIHDYGEVDGQAYFVMDLIAGRNLEKLCAGRPLEARRAAALLRKLALAAHHAHVAGVIHRDLKPSNVIVDDADEPHVTDFGLARLVERVDGATLSGQVLGSPGYAAPEQVEGRTEDVGVASDLFSLGALGYHLVTGRAPFVGKNTRDTVRLVLEGLLTPPRRHNAALPRAFEAILLKCLEREPARRYVSAAELAGDLERWLAGRPVGATLRRRLRGVSARPVAWLAAAGAAALAGWWGHASFGRWGAPAPAATATVIRASIELPVDAPLAPAAALPLGLRALSLAISPDGANLVYVAQVGDTTQLQVRPLGEDRVRPLAGTEGGYRPAFSPDGRWIAFLTSAHVKKIAVAGGGPVTISDMIDDSYGITWGADDRIYFSERGILKRVPAGGGSVETVTEGLVLGFTAAERGTGLLGLFSAGPGGNGDYRPLECLAIPAGSVAALGFRGHSARILPGGLLVFARGNGLSAAWLEGPEGVRTSESVPVLDGVQSDALHWVSQYAVSDSGTLVYAEGEALGRSLVVWVDRGGQVRPLPLPAQNHAMFDLSPDGRTLATLVRDAEPGILLVDAETGNISAVMVRGDVGHPFWSPDGRLCFVAVQAGRRVILATAPDALDRAPTIVYRAPDDSFRVRMHTAFPPPDGRILLTVSRSGGRVDYLLLSPDGGVAAAGPEVTGGFLQISPDGRWLASTRNHSGRSEIFVQRFPKGPSIQVTFKGGEEARWSSRRDELFCRYGDTWMAIPVTLEPDFKAGEPRELFRGPYENITGYSYCVAPGDGRFLLLLPEHVEQPATHLKIVVNWHEEVRRQLATAHGAATKRER